MAIQDNSVLWTKLENLTSEIGPNGVAIGVPVYAPARFNNGADTTNINTISWAAGLPATVKMIIEYWWKPKWNSGTAGVYYSCFGTNASNDFILINHSGALTFHVAYFVGAVKKLDYRYNFAYTAGTLYHVLLALDSDLGVHNRAKVYIDGVLKVPNVYTTDLVYTTPRTRNFALSDPWVNNQPANAVIDNLKVYDTTVDLAAILANRNNEGWPVAGGKRMIDGGVRSNMIDGSVLVN